MNRDIYDLICNRRSIRRFQQKKIETELLEQMVNLGRLAPSAANLQPVEYVIVDDKYLCEELFNTIGWAGYIKPKWTPEPDERPVAYIVILVNKRVKSPWSVRDVCFASENIVLYAESVDIGSCILLKIDKEKIRDILNIPSGFEIDTLIALGYKAEQPIVEENNDSVTYYRDKNQVLNVPKKSLNKIIHHNKF